MQMKATSAGTVLWVFLALPAHGQEDAARALFRAERINFWGETKTRPPSDRTEESIWAEPIRTPDGRVSVYVPPKPVLAFLEKPSREMGEKYLAWQEERMRKLKAAIEVLKKIQAERGAAAGRSPEGEVLYFKREGCPWCREEDKVLAQLTKDHPRVKVRPVSPTEAPELWKEYGVTVVPTLVVKSPQGKAVVLRGFTPSARILTAFQEVPRDNQ